MASLPNYSDKASISSRHSEERKKSRQKRAPSAEAMLGNSPQKVTAVRKILDLAHRLQEIDLSLALKEYEGLMKNSNLESALESENAYFTRLSRQRLTSGDSSTERTELLGKSNEIKDLTEHKRQLEERIRNLELETKYVKQQLQEQLENKTKQLERAEEEKNNLKTELETIKRSNSYTGSSSPIAKLQGEIEDLTKKLKRNEAELKSREVEQVQWLETMNAMKVEIEQESVKLRTDLEKQQKIEITLRKQLKEEQRKASAAETAKAEALTRLSKEMGTKLNDNNPAIADLSDPNRATKLAEMYNELYDNEWTDALEILERHYREEASIRILLEIVKNVYAFCNKKAKSQLEDMHKIFFSQPMSDEENEAGGMNQNRRMIMKMLKDCRKSTAEQAVTQIYHDYTSRYETNNASTVIPGYVEKVVKICWLMNVQDPPVVIGKQADSYEPLNTDIYKPYTKTGTVVSYTVWLPLYLYEGGPLLSKGVAQPIPSIQKSRAVSAPSNYRNQDDERAPSNYRYQDDERVLDTEAATLYNHKPGRMNTSDAASYLAEHTKKSAMEVTATPKMAWPEHDNLTSPKHETQRNSHITGHTQISPQSYGSYSTYQDRRTNALSPPSSAVVGTGRLTTPTHDFNTSGFHRQYEQSTVPTRRYTSYNPITGHWS